MRERGESADVVSQPGLQVADTAYAEQLAWCRQEVAQYARQAGSSVPTVHYQQHVDGDSDYRNSRIRLSENVMRLPRVALQGVLAHEFAHHVRPSLRGLRLTGVVLLFWMGLVTGTAALAHSKSGGIVTVLFVSQLCFAGLIGCAGYGLQRREETKTDAQAVDILGTPGPIYAWLEGLRDHELGKPRKGSARIFAEHPTPSRRLKQLQTRWPNPPVS